METTPRADFLDKIAYWPWDFSMVWDGLVEFVAYYYHAYGFEAVIAIATIAVVLLLSFDLTRRPVHSFLATVGDAFTRVVVYGGMAMLATGAMRLWGRLLAWGRSGLRLLQQIFS